MDGVSARQIVVPDKRLALAILQLEADEWLSGGELLLAPCCRIARARRLAMTRQSCGGMGAACCASLPCTADMCSSRAAYMWKGDHFMFGMMREQGCMRSRDNECAQQVLFVVRQSCGGMGAACCAGLCGVMGVASAQETSSSRSSADV